MPRPESPVRGWDRSAASPARRGRRPRNARGRERRAQGGRAPSLPWLSPQSVSGHLTPRSCATLNLVGTPPIPRRPGPYAHPVDLSGPELRVIGCLVEKQLTTPQQYPLTLNALTLACNQTSNRDPVVDFDEATVQQAVTSVKAKGLAAFVHPSHGRSALDR